MLTMPPQAITSAPTDNPSMTGRLRPAGAARALSEDNETAVGTVILKHSFDQLAFVVFVVWLMGVYPASRAAESG